MTFYDTQLQQLQEKLARKGQLKATQSNTEAEIARLSTALDALVRNAQL